MKKIKNFSKVNHCGNIQMLGQVNPKIYEMVKYHLNELKSELLDYNNSSEFLEIVINYHVLDMLQDLQDLLFELGYIKRDLKKNKKEGNQLKIMD